MTAVKTLVIYLNVLLKGVIKKFMIILIYSKTEKKVHSLHMKNFYLVH